MTYSRIQYILKHIFRCANGSQRNQKKTYVDPRLAFRMIKKRRIFDSFSTAMDVLQGQNLSVGIALITGASSGIGKSIIISFENILYASLIVTLP